MATYDLSAIKAALTKGEKGSNSNSGGAGFTKTVYWKATMGEHDIRFLPIESSTGEPFMTVAYYDKPLVEKRIVAPFCMGKPDFIKEQYEELRQSKKHPDGWAIAKHLRSKDRFYAAIIVRGEEDKGPQVWEFSKEIRDAIYGILTHKDNVDEDMLSTTDGYDFTLTVTPAMEGGKPKLWNGSPVKNINVQPRKKPSPLSKDKALVTKWLAATPKFEEMFGRQCKTNEELTEILENFVAGLSGGSAKPSAEGTDHNATRGANPASTSEAEDQLDDAFSDLT